MQILRLKSVASTQDYLLKLLKDKKASPPYSIISDEQTDGRGSRGNSWIGYKGNLFLSFCYYLDDLPKDVPIISTSIFFGYIFKDTLSSYGSCVWLKWPNDIYLDDKKVGGIITSKISYDGRDCLVCGIGLNLKNAPDKFAVMDVNFCVDELIDKFFKKIENITSWKDIFKSYKIEFQKSKKYSFNNLESVLSLKNATINDDATIMVDGERIVGTR